MSTDIERKAAERIAVRFGNLVTDVFEDKRGQVLSVALEAIPDILEALRRDEESPFDMLVDITAVDWSTWHEETGLSPKKERFSLYYALYSIKTRSRLFLEAFVGEHQFAPSATSVYASADWAEREIFDMFGITFSGHPDLRRILMPEDFTGYPLRKEFPAAGYDPQDFPQE